ncbi:radical SAM protein [Candidatus Woesearchaeota archaeon]|nr:radical SAM protein [Candidatus Woesearchaeota archaeon]
MFKKFLGIFKRRKKLSFPKKIAIETTTHCNAVCPFCPIHGPESDMTRPKGIMSMELFEKIMRQVHKNQDYIETIYLNVCGEPLIEPEFISRLHVIEEFGIGEKIDIQTNGQFLTEEKAKAILNAKIGCITLGFDGASKEVYEKHRLNCNYELVLENMKGFLELRNQSNSKTKVMIKYVHTPHNKHEIGAARDMWKKMLSPNLDMFVVSPSENWATPRIDKSGFVIKTVANSNKELIPCPMLDEFMNIFYDGKVPACCWDYNLDISNGGMGDTNKQSLAEIWNGAAFKNLRKKHAKLDFENLPRCTKCSQILRY